MSAGGESQPAAAGGPRPPPGLEDFAPDVAQGPPPTQQPAPAAREQQHRPTAASAQQPSRPQQGGQGRPPVQGGQQSPTQQRQPPTQQRQSPRQPGFVNGSAESGARTSPAQMPRTTTGRPSQAPMPSMPQQRGGLAPTDRQMQGVPQDGGGPQQWLANQQMQGKGAPASYGGYGQPAPGSMGRQEPPQNWLAGHQQGHDQPQRSAAGQGGAGFAGPGGMPEAQMLPSPGLPGPSHMQQMPGMSMPMPWGMGQQNLGRAPAHQVGGHFSDAISTALQKFAAAEEVQKAATKAPVSKEGRPRTSQPSRSAEQAHIMEESNPVIAAANQEMMLQQRLEAQAQAEATAARLMASGAPIAPAAAGSDSRAKPKSEDLSAELLAESLWPGAQEKRYEGRVKTFNVVQGFGFIQSVEMHQLYGCDAFLNTAVVGGLVIGGTVSFTVEMKNGKPQARNVRLEDASVPDTGKEFDAPGLPVPGPQAGIHRGRVKSFNAQKGFGFIASSDLQYKFGRDIYVSRTQAPDGTLSVGQEVEFQLVLDRQGQPQARDIKPVQMKRGPGMVTPTGAGLAGMPLFA